MPYAIYDSTDRGTYRKWVSKDSFGGTDDPPTDQTENFAASDVQSSPPKKGWPKFVKPNRHERRKAKAGRK